ncbi:hypothetical protein FJZ36_04750 [Candidatus Poribacteria bacterium]|nr:hypothetical protein [Candidatus Poribacteria bacterium]
MLDRLHEHIVQELQQNARSESIFVLTAIALNLITVGVNSGLASDMTVRTVAVLVVTVSLVVVVNMVALMGLLRGRDSKTRLLNGLLKMYRDQNIAEYYDGGLLDDYRMRYRLLVVGVLATGAASILIPAVILST